MDILKNIHIGDQSIDDKGQVKIMDEDRLCFLVRAESRGAYGLRTISKQLLREYVAYFQLHPNNNANQAREDLCGKTDLDKFEYGYSATLMRMAKMMINPETQIIRSQSNTSLITNRHHEIFSFQQIYYGASGTGKSYEVKDITKGYSTIPPHSIPIATIPLLSVHTNRPWKKRLCMVRKVLRWQRRNASPTPLSSKPF